MYLFCLVYLLLECGTVLGPWFCDCVCVDERSKTIQREDWMVGVCFEHIRFDLTHEGFFCCVYQPDLRITSN